MQTLLTAHQVLLGPLCLKYQTRSCENSSFTSTEDPACSCQSPAGSLAPGLFPTPFFPVSPGAHPSLQVHGFLLRHHSPGIVRQVWWACHESHTGPFGLSQGHQHQVIKLMSSLKLPCPGDIYWCPAGNNVSLCKCGPISLNQSRERLFYQTVFKTYFPPEEF